MASSELMSGKQRGPIDRVRSMSLEHIILRQLTDTPISPRSPRSSASLPATGAQLAGCLALFQYSIMPHSNGCKCTEIDSAS